MSTETNETGAPEMPDVAVTVWQETLTKSVALNDKSVQARKKASAMLWAGACEGIENCGGDTEGLRQDALTAMGQSRRGDVSKIVAVAVAVKSHGLDLSRHTTLAGAYKDAMDRTKVKAQRGTEDEAAESATSNMTPPKTATTAESAAILVLFKGVDEAARLLLDALGQTNEDAHRAFIRALSSEMAGRRVVEKKAAVADKPKAGAVQATGRTAKKAAAPKVAVKAKPEKVAVEKVTVKQPVKAEVKAKPEQPVAEKVAGAVGTEPVAVKQPVKMPVKKLPVRAR